VITRFGLAPRREGWTVERFQEHWRRRHGPIIGGLPGLVRYWQNHALAAPLPWPGFDACSQLDAPDAATFDAVFAHPTYLTDGRADERRFVDRSVGGHLMAERVVAEGRTDPVGVRLLAFLRAAPRCGPADVATVLTAPGRGGDAVGREAFARVPGASGDAFDAVESLWFDDAAAAVAHLRSAAAERDRRALAGVVRGTEHLLAAVHVVL
jgi:uncharacterized protein (TIGR02118 family)